MKVAKWGNSLALRLPATVVDILDLKEGDEVSVRVAGSYEIDVARDTSADDWLMRLRRFRGTLPADFKFDRDEANAR